MELRLEGNETIIYVAGKPFMQCKYLLLNVPTGRLNDFDSIDQAQQYLKTSLETELLPEEIGLSPEDEFHAHCSNLEVWVENGYNTALLHRNLAFPLLKALVEAGDESAKRIFKEEIEDRFRSLFPPVQTYLIQEGYLNYFKKEEIVELLNLISDTRVWENIAEHCETQKQYLNSIQALKKALSLDPINYNNLFKLAKFNMKIGDYHNAISTFRRILELFPHKKEINIHIGQCYLEVGDYIRAENEFLDALLANQCDFYAWELLGTLYRKEGKLNKAIRAFKTSVLLYPYATDPWIEISFLYLKKNKAPLAIKMLKIALEYNPENEFLWLAFKRIMKRVGKGWKTFFLFFKYQKKWKRRRKIPN